MTTSSRLLTIAILAIVTQATTRDVFAHTPRPGQRYLYHTDPLLGDLASASRNLSDLAARLDRIHATTQSTRKKAELVSSMIKEIKTVEDQIHRIRRELSTFAKIPQLKMLKPIVIGLERLNAKVIVIRKRADRIRRDTIDPGIKKMKSFEKDVKDASRQIKQAQADTKRSQARLSTLRKYVADRGYPNREVRILEASSQATRYPVRAILPVLKEINSSTAKVEASLTTYGNSLASVTALRPGISQLKSKLTPVDRKARNIASVLSRRLKLPGGKSITIRKVLEAPGDLADFILKPLQKIAQAALKPITGKLKFELKPPKQFVQIQERLNALKKPADLTAIQRQLQQLRSVQLTQLSAALRKLDTTSLNRCGTGSSPVKPMPGLVIWGK